MNAGADAEVAVNLARLRRRIELAAGAAGRDPATVRVVAITKAATVEQLKAAVAAGITDIGENRTRELCAKRSVACEDGAGAEALTWHLVGHLQRNKAAAAADCADVVQSVDSERLARTLAERRRSSSPSPLGVLVEVDLTGIPGRTGVTLEAAAGLCAEVGRLAPLQLLGLMTIAARATDLEPAGCFGRLRRLRDQLEQQLSRGLPQLSMGMSDDFEVAIAHGSTMVRIGRMLFAR